MNDKNIIAHPAGLVKENMAFRESAQISTGKFYTPNRKNTGNYIAKRGFLCYNKINGRDAGILQSLGGLTMKKLLCLMLCAALVFGLAGCAKLEITPTSEIAAIRDDTMSYPDHKFEYNNEISAKTLKAVKRKRLLDYRWSIGGGAYPPIFSSQGYISWQDLQEVVGEDSFCLRYNYGKYYTVIRVSDGSYLFVLFSEDDEVWPKFWEYTDSCFIKKLSDTEKVDRIKVGDLKRKVKSSLSNYWSFELVDLSPPMKDIYISRFNDLTTRTYTFEDGKLVKVDITPPENSVLTYLLPQDLALIS